MEERLRIDKWLWYARFYKTRPLAQKAADSGVIRLNGQRVRKSGTFIRPGDVLTVPRGREPVALRIVALGTRRGPATEAQALYEILAETGLDRGACGP
jgi:ribosome-associated heat shock protein Hsp15